MAYLVQAYRVGQFTTWTTDRRTDDLAEAREAAVTLHRQFGRTTRVVDDHEVVHCRFGTIADARRLTRGPRA